MTANHLRVLPNPTAAAMQQLGETTITGVLGSYDDLLDERDRLFTAMLSEMPEDPETWADDSRATFKLWLAAGRRLDLYRLLANEVGS